MKPSFVMEVSFEIGNKVGGIWTVVSTKAKKLAEAYGRRYMPVGLYVPEKFEILEEELPEIFKEIAERLDSKGIKLHYGLWIPAGVKAFFLDVKEFMKEKNRIKAELWEKKRIDSLFAPPDYDLPVVFGYAAGLFAREVAEAFGGLGILHAHEWLSGVALIHASIYGTRVAKVFTTHATVVGRALSGRITPEILQRLEEIARAKGVWEKHQVEKVSAEVADVFTAVSDATAEEAAKVLGRKPEVVTPNGLPQEKIPNIADLLRKKLTLQEKLKDFLATYFFPYHAFPLEDIPVIFTSGRYEIYNKGFDLFIKALGILDRMLRQSPVQKYVVAFVLTPTGTLGIKDEIAEHFMARNRLEEIVVEEARELMKRAMEKELSREDIAGFLRNLRAATARFARKTRRNAPLTPFQLANKNDEILKLLRQEGLCNSPENRVKVVYYPVYLNREDALLGMNYFDFVTVASAGVFLSRYEPWGYTPQEAGAFASIAVTTTASGFGKAVMAMGTLPGIFVVPVERAAEETARILYNLVLLPKERRLSVELAANKVIRRYFSWKRLIRRYFKAYNLALKKYLRKMAAALSASQEDQPELPQAP